MPRLHLSPHGLPGLNWLRSSSRLSLLAPTLALACSTGETGASGTASAGSTSGATTMTTTDGSTSGPTGNTDPTFDPSTSSPTSGGGETDSGSTSGTAGTSDTTGSLTTGLGESTGDLDTTGAPPPEPFCGDGVVDGDLGEQCDLGEANADDGACTLGCKSAACGDGLVQTDVEACDDGNQDDTDTCLNTCTNAACGDSVVGPGEACDDGNQVDDDACGNDCTLASCGDAKPQPGEACDDGDKDDTDACLSTCVLASCGDGFVQAGVEACDDGDADESDDCTTLCKAPTCDDAIKSGLETDVDCGGGTCDTCSQGQSCLEDSDCDTGACFAGTCGLPVSCKQIKGALPASKDGTYTLDPDQGGPVEPFKVWCDMTVDGGGWTSLVHHTTLDRLNYALPFTQVAVSEATRFWIFAKKPDVAYSVKEYNGKGATNYEAEAASPAATGFTWNGVDYPNPDGCHVFQQMILVQTPAEHPRVNGNPHFNGGQANPAGLEPAALVTASTIDVAPVANFPSIHIGCVGWNVLKDPILWIR
jgi:cysteine-rich repeat protein